MSENFNQRENIVNKRLGKKPRKIISRTATWVMIIFVIAAVGFFVAKDRLIYAGQWGQVKSDLLERLGLKPDLHVSLTYIPIADTVFLIPSNKWLKDYWKDSTNSLVSAIRLEMSPEALSLPLGEHRFKDGLFVSKDKVVVILEHKKIPDIIRDFPRVPNSFLSSAISSIEEPSDQKAQGLRRFRRLLNGHINIAEKTEKELGMAGEEFILGEDGQYYRAYKEMVDYILVEKNRVKCFITCGDGRGAIKENLCYLYFPWNDHIMVEIVLVKELLPRAVAFADKAAKQLHQFEVDGRTYQKAFPEMRGPHGTWAWSSPRGGLNDFRSDEPKGSPFVQWINGL